MEHFTPTEQAGETCTNVRQFVGKNNSEIWKIFRVLAPYIAGLYFFDAIVSSLFFDKGGAGFFLGSIVASYFYICLIISWFRFVIKGAEGYTPVDPLKPQNKDLGFIGVGLAIWLAVYLAMTTTYSIVEGMSIMNSFFLGLPLIFAMFVLSIYAAYRLWFYFPAKAVDAPVSLMEAFSNSGGYLWQLIYASFLASLKTMALVFAYSIVVWLIGFSVKMDGFFISFLFDLPIHLYFQPVLVVLGVTAVSNYYLYVLHGSEEAVSESVADDVAGEE